MGLSLTSPTLRVGRRRRKEGLPWASSRPFCGGAAPRSRRTERWLKPGSREGRAMPVSMTETQFR